MTNDITINPLEIIKLPDNSITDYETIRQIALWSIRFNDNSLNSKIKHEFQFAGLYPHVQKLFHTHDMKVFNPELAKKITESGRETIQEVRTAIHHSTNDDNYQAEIDYAKYEIMLICKTDCKIGHKKGATHKLINKIFDSNNGIAFFQIDNNWDILWRRQFTGFFDKEKTEIYDGDYLEDDECIYLVVWNRNQTQWWLIVVKMKHLDSEDIFEYVMKTQSLGNGYFKRDDLLKIGNKFENPEIEES